VPLFVEEHLRLSIVPFACIGIGTGICVVVVLLLAVDVRTELELP